LLDKWPDREEDQVSDIKERVLRRIRKLVALAEGGATEAEAETALRLAHEMLAEHNLSMDDVPENSDDVDPVTSDGEEWDRYNEAWRRTLMHSAAQLYFCRYFFSDKIVPGKNTALSQRGVKHTFVGRPHNVAVARLMGRYFVTTVNRLANDGCRKTVIRSRTERGRYVNTFRLACAERLRERCVKVRERAEAGQAVTSDGRNLPALANMYRREMRANDEFLHNMKIRLREQKSRASFHDTRGYNDGRTAADSISLSAQVGTGRGAKLIR
jgi:hypothetical protein